MTHWLTVRLCSATLYLIFISFTINWGYTSLNRKKDIELTDDVIAPVTASGDDIAETESAIKLEGLINKHVFGKVSADIFKKEQQVEISIHRIGSCAYGMLKSRAGGFAVG